MFGNDFMQFGVREEEYDFARQRRRMETSDNFTLALDNQFVGTMMQTFMACQRCKEIVNRSKQLKCFHPICYRCAYQVRTKHSEPGQWKISCTVCNVVTTWFGNELENLPDNGTVQKVIDKTKRHQRRRSLASQSGRITMYGEHDLTINIVSYAKEKEEIDKVLKSAQTKIRKCQEQTQQVKEYEKSVRKAKSLLRKQIKQATSRYISAIQLQQEQLLEELDQMFDDDFQPAKKAKEAIEMQRQSLTLVTQCCSVASRILQNGGAPLDLDSFKKMIRETMDKTKAGKLPSVIHKTYNCHVAFKSQKSIYKSLAGQIGCLEMNKDEFEEEKHKALTGGSEEKPTPAEDHAIPSEDDEPIYDLPPDVANEGLRPQEEDELQAQEECLYDEIPFDAKEISPAESDEIDDSPLPPPPAFALNGVGFNTMNRATAIVTQRRKAINGSDSENSDSDDSFSSDPSCSDHSPTPSHGGNEPNNTRSSAHPIRVGSASATTPSHNNVSFEVEPSKESQQRHRKNSKSAETFQQELGAKNQKLKRHKSFNRSPPSSVIALEGRNAESTNKLLFCIGKMKKQGFCETLQRFASTPELSTGPDDRIWISDVHDHRIQTNDGATGSCVGVFKMSIHGVTAKAKDIAVLSSGDQVAAAYAKYVTVWHERGELRKQIGPHPEFGKLGGIAVAPGGEIVVYDCENGKIYFTNSGRQIRNVSSVSSHHGKSPAQGKIAINKLGQVIVPDYGQHVVKIYSSDGTLLKDFGSFGVAAGQFRYPSAVCTDDQNRIFVADECNNRISMFSSRGEYLGCPLTKDDGLTFPKSISLLSGNRIAVADEGKLVKVYSFVN